MRIPERTFLCILRRKRFNNSPRSIIGEKGCLVCPLRVAYMNPLCRGGEVNNWFRVFLEKRGDFDAYFRK